MRTPLFYVLIILGALMTAACDDMATPFSPSATIEVPATGEAMQSSTVGILDRGER
jgi:hypothetical protein